MSVHIIHEVDPFSTNIAYRFPSLLYYSYTNVLYRRFLLLIARRMKTVIQKTKISFLLCLTITLIVSLALITTHSGLANAQQNNTLMQPKGVQGMTTNATN